jgi:hypothetical protein
MGRYAAWGLLPCENRGLAPPAKPHIAAPRLTPFGSTEPGFRGLQIEQQIPRGLKPARDDNNK